MYFLKNVSIYPLGPFIKNCNYAACGLPRNRDQRSITGRSTISAIVSATCNYMSVVFFRMATELANKKAEREALRGVIQQWNANRLDLFELSEPNEVSVADEASKFCKIVSLPQVYSNYFFFSIGFGVSWRDEVLFPRQRPKSRYQMHQGRLGCDQPGSDRNSHRKISSWHENAVRTRICSLRDSWEWRWVKSSLNPYIKGQNWYN